MSEETAWSGCSLSALGADATRYEVPAGLPVSGDGRCHGVFMMCGLGFFARRHFRGGRGTLVTFTSFGGWLLLRFCVLTFMFGSIYNICRR